MVMKAPKTLGNQLGRWAVHHNFPVIKIAKALLQRRGNEYMQAELANNFKNDMNQLTQAERAIAASKMPPEEKRAQLDKIRKIKTAVAQTVRDVSDKTILLASPF